MINITGKLAFLLISTSIILSTACSSGSDTSAVTSYSGSTTPAAIDTDNAEDIGTAAGEAILIADSSTGLPAGITVNSSTSPDLTQLNNLVLSNFNILTMPVGVDMPGVCTTGSVSISDGDFVNTTSGPLDITMTYNNCLITDSGITASGRVIIHYDDFGNFDAAFSVIYDNFVVSDANGTHTINATMDCTNFTSCTFNSDFVGTDGVTHRVTEFNITGDVTTWFTGTATFYHGTYGSVSISATSITYGSCGSFPDGGTIAFQSTDGTSGTIIFNSDCTVSGTWDDGVASGSF